MTRHFTIAYGDERNEGLIPLTNQLDELGFDWTAERSRMDFRDCCAVLGHRSAYFDHVVC